MKHSSQTPHPYAVCFIALFSGSHAPTHTHRHTVILSVKRLLAMVDVCFVKIVNRISRFVSTAS